MSASCQFKTRNLENASNISGFCEAPMNCVLVGTQQALAIIALLRLLLQAANPSGGQRVRKDQILGVRRCQNSECAPFPGL